MVAAELIEQKLLDRLYALQCLETQERDPVMKRALGKDIALVLSVLRLVRDAAKET